MPIMSLGAQLALLNKHWEDWTPSDLDTIRWMFAGSCCKTIEELTLQKEIELFEEEQLDGIEQRRHEYACQRSLRVTHP